MTPAGGAEAAREAAGTAEQVYEGRLSGHGSGSVWIAGDGFFR